MSRESRGFFLGRRLRRGYATVTQVVTRWLRGGYAVVTQVVTHPRGFYLGRRAAGARGARGAGNVGRADTC